MSITPADIQQMRFSEAKRGYNPSEVDVFLETCAAEVDAMLRKIADLKGRLTNAEQQLAQTQSQLASRPAPVQAAPVSSTGATEQQISAALITAQQSADRIVGEAKAEASRIREEADNKAREVIRQALAEKQAELDEIERLKASREEFRASYLKLIQHFKDDANAVFPKAMLSSSTPNGSEPKKAAPAAAVPAQSAVAQSPAPAPAAQDADKTVLAPALNASVDVDDLD